MSEAVPEETFPVVPPRSTDDPIVWEPARAGRIAQPFETRNAREGHGVTKAFVKPSLTQQHFAKDCDINVLWDRFRRGDMSVVNPRPAFTGDFSHAVSLHEARILMEEAQAEFDALPAKVRQAAGDPETLLRMLEDEEGAATLQAAGLPLRLPSDSDVQHLDEATQAIVKRLEALQSPDPGVSGGQGDSDSPE